MGYRSGNINWTAIGVVVAALTLFVVLIAWLDSRAKDEREKAAEPAKLIVLKPKPIPADGVVPAAEYMPWGQEMPTPISFRNDGKREALVKQVILSKWKWVVTPKRENIHGAGKTIRVAFERRHFIKETGQYMLVLREPRPAPGGGEWTTLEVALVDPEAVGQTLVGTVTILFDGLEQQHFQDVQIDALTQSPW